MSDVWIVSSSFLSLTLLFEIGIAAANRNLYMYEVKGCKVFVLFVFVPIHVPVWDFLGVEEQMKQHRAGRKQYFEPWRGAVHARRIPVRAQSSDSDGNLLPRWKPSKGCFELFPQSWLFLQSGDGGKCGWLGFDRLSEEEYWIILDLAGFDLLILFSVEFEGAQPINRGLFRRRSG